MTKLLRCKYTLPIRRAKRVEHVHFKKLISVYAYVYVCLCVNKTDVKFEMHSRLTNVGWTLATLLHFCDTET